MYLYNNMSLASKLNKSIKSYTKHEVNMRRKGIGIMEEMKRENAGRHNSKLKALEKYK